MLRMAGNTLGENVSNAISSTDIGGKSRTGNLNVKGVKIMERNERRIRHNYDNPLILALVIKLDAVNIGKVPKFLEDTFGASIIYQKTAPANHRLYIREEGRDRYEH